MAFRGEQSQSVLKERYSDMFVANHEILMMRRIFEQAHWVCRNGPV